jgi:murein tripeptide amidase MpaA
VKDRNTNRTKTLEYITKQLIDGYKSGDNLTQTFLNKYDFYIFPIVNPDGKSVIRR